uniref:Uncharacterized protein n=1 Tax=Arundo donax TaxID=35708 RepID=A0A0A8ZL20_ARUDO
MAPSLPSRSSMVKCALWKGSSLLRLKHYR